MIEASVDLAPRSREALDVGDTGTVLMSDLRKSTMGQETGRLDAHGERLREYFESFLAALREGSEQYATDLLEITHQGDGCAIVLGQSPGILKLALHLQGQCDQFAHGLLGDFDPQAWRHLDEQFCWATGIGVATDELLPIQDEKRDRDPWLLSRGFRRRFSGSVFNAARRIESKTKPMRACFSPLFDERTRDESDQDGLRVFPVGHFVLDKKVALEVPVIDLFEGQPANHERLFSAVKQGSILEDAAKLFERVVTRSYQYERRAAMMSVVQLREYLDANREEILAECGRIALWRWYYTVYHYSFLAGGSRAVSGATP